MSTNTSGENPPTAAGLAEAGSVAAPCIRPATVADLSALVALNAHVQSLHAEALPEQFRANPPTTEVAATFAEKLAEPTALWLLAELGGSPCGYLYAQFREHEENWARPARRACNLAHVAVHPAHRRQGIARALIEAAIAEAGRRGFARIELDVWSFNTEAREAFGRLGFTTFNERMEWMAPASHRP
jgi:ribosomal protein S18 acetylase RimI-like enzyme